MNNLKHEIDSSNYDICPYCGEKMVLRFKDKSIRGYAYRQCNEQIIYPFVQFECRFCNSRSPSIELTPTLINTEAVKTSMYEYVNILDEDEEEQ